MSDGLKAIAASIVVGSAASLIGVPTEMFIEGEQIALDFVRQHYRQYRALPTTATVRQETGVRLPQAPEPLAYYIDRLYERHQYNLIRERFASLRDGLSALDMTAVSASVSDMYRVTRQSSRRGREVVNLREGYELVEQRLSETRGYGGITGIEVGWPGYDAITGGYQAADLVSIVGRPSQGKCMDPNTEVVMATGQLRKIGELRAGDRLMGPDSQPRTVLTTIRGRDPMYRVSGTGGEPFVCNGAHILVLTCSSDVNETYRKGGSYFLSVDAYLALAPRVQRKLRLVRAAVEFPESDVEVSPYYVGVWLGDGSRSNGRISTVDPEIVAAVHDEARRFGMDVVQCESRSGMCPQYSLVNGRGKDHVVMDFFRNDCMKDREKRIPRAYLWNSTKVRMHLLAGMLDTDGYLGSSTGFEFVTKWTGLRDDFTYLCRSLGFRARPVAKVVNGVKYHRVYVTGALHEVPTRIPRKQARPHKRRFPVEHASFTVEPLGEGEYAGITLDKDHLYLLKDFTVTHNTYILLQQAWHAHEVAGKTVLFVTTEMGTEQIMRRHASIAIGVNPTLLRMNMISSHLQRRLREFYRTMVGAEGFNIFSVGMNAQVSAIEALIQELDPDIIFVDGGYLLRPTSGPKNMNRTERITGVYDESRGLTLESNKPMVISTQFNRAAGKGGAEGSLENIGYTDAIGTHSSSVVAIRPGPTANPKASRWLDFLKGREGETGKIAINFKFAPTDMSEFTPENTGEDEAGGAATSGNVDWME